MYKMNPYANWPKDPYADSSVERPRNRKRNPLDPREPYKRTFTQAPVTGPFPPTGSLYYRWGVFNGRLMTPKEQRFEHFISDMQARHDEISELREWRRLKDIEEEAVLLYHELGNIVEYTRQMSTRDQMETEYQCQRKRQKAEDLNPWATALKHGQERLRAEAEERARDQERIRSSFKARIQQASQQSGLTPPKPEKCGNTSQAVPSTEAGSSRQQEPKIQLSAEEVRRQFQDEFRFQLATTTTRLTTTTSVRSVSLETATSARGTRAKELDVAMPTARQDSVKAELPGYQPPMGVIQVTHLPKGSVLVSKRPGLPELHLGCPSVAEQSPTLSIGQPSDTSQEHRITGSIEHRSTSPSSRQTRSEGSTPPSSVPSSPPKSPKEEVDNSSALLELEWNAHGTVKSTSRWEKLKPSTRNNPFLNSLIREHIDRQRMNGWALMEERSKNERSQGTPSSRSEGNIWGPAGLSGRFLGNGAMGR